MSFSREENMNPVVRAVYFMGNSFLIIVTLLSAVWWVIVAHLYVAYGLPAALAFAMGSTILPAAAIGMKHHDHHDGYDHHEGCNSRCDRR